MSARPPRLILLNGPPGIGKSTLARRYVDERPMAFCLDIDGLRSLLGKWDDDEERSGILARRMALAMAATHLSGGHDVIVPQYVARANFIGELAQVAQSSAASFHEVFLTDTKSAALARFEARRDDPVAAAHHAMAVKMIGGVRGFEDMYDRIEALRGSRPAAVTVVSAAGETDLAYAAVVAAVEVGATATPPDEPDVNTCR